MKSEGFEPEKLSEEEKARLAAEAKAEEERMEKESAVQGIVTKFPNIKKQDVVLDTENFNISVGKKGKISREIDIDKTAREDAAKLGIETVSPSKESRVVDSENFNPSKREIIEKENKIATSKLLKDLARAEKNGPTPKSIKIQKELLDLQKIPKGRRVEALQGKIEEAKINTEKEIAKAVEKGQTAKIEKLKKELESITRKVTPTDMEALKSAKEKARSDAVEKEEVKKAADEAKLESTRISLEAETKRTQNEARLLKGGAEYIIDEKGNNTLVLTEEQTQRIAAEEKADKQNKLEKIKAERKGIKDVSIAKNIGKGALDTALSIFGARFPVAAAELYSFNKNKKGAKIAASELLETITLKNSQSQEGLEKPISQSKLEKGRVIEEAELIEGGAKYSFNEKGERVLNMTKKQIEEARKEMNSEKAEESRVENLLKKRIVKSPINPKENTEVGPVRDRIRSFNEKLKNIDLPAAEKQELRNQMATLLKEHRHDSNKLEAQKVEKVSKVFDVYANSSAKVMGVAKETVNTLSICAGMPFVRLLGYSVFSGAESFMKAGNIYDRNHFKDGEVNTKEKLAYIGKSLTIDAANETYGAYADILKKDTYKDRGTLGKVWGKAVAKTFSLGFTALRVAGLVKFEEQLLSGGNILADGGDKFVEAFKGGRVAEALKQGGDNWVNNTQYMLSLVGIGQDPNEIGKTTANNSDAKPAYAATGGNVENTSYIVNEKSTEVLSGEGPQHAIGRQVKENLNSFGFNGDINDSKEVASFVQEKTHEIVTKNGLDNIGIKEAGTKIILNQNGIVSGLTPDNTYHIPSTNEVLNQALIKQAVMDDNVNSLIPTVDGLSGSGDEMNQEFDKAMQFDDRIKNDIFHIQSSGKNGLSEWEKVQNLSANDIIDRKYGDLTKSEYYDPSGKYEANTKLHYDRLAGDLEELSAKTPINDGESVIEYYKRVYGIRSADLNDYIKNPTISENLRTQSVVNKIKDIYTGWFGINQIEEWDKVKSLSAADALAGEFGDYLGEKDLTEIGNRKELQEYLGELLKKTKLAMGDKETVEAFIIRANKIRSLKV